MDIAWLSQDDMVKFFVSNFAFTQIFLLLFHRFKISMKTRKVQINEIFLISGQQNNQHDNKKT